jgi:hypothetical protein
MALCEDYPCCGHTNDDPCGPQWYDEPDAFDITVNPHALCEHEYGLCEVEDDEDYEEPDDEDYFDGYEGPEDAWLDGSYEE